MTPNRTSNINLSILALSLLFLFVGCGSPVRDAPSLPDAASLDRASIRLTSEARAEATRSASGNPQDGFQGRTNAGSTPLQPTSPPKDQPTDQPPTPTAGAIVEAQLTKAPTVAAFLTMVATTTAAEGTPSPPSGCPGGCTSYPTWCEPPIKGSVSVENGERTYSMPSDDPYPNTPIEPDKGDRYFCTPAEAEEAGFQRAS